LHSWEASQCADSTQISLTPIAGLAQRLLPPRPRRDPGFAVKVEKNLTGQPGLAAFQPSFFNAMAWRLSRLEWLRNTLDMNEVCARARRSSRVVDYVNPRRSTRRPAQATVVAGARPHSAHRFVIVLLAFDLTEVGDACAEPLGDEVGHGGGGESERSVDGIGQAGGAVLPLCEAVHEDLVGA
jgi:hypothetical protein